MTNIELNSNKKSYLECNKEAAKCLSTCIGYALYNIKNNSCIDINDIESLREALRILRPNIKGLNYFDAAIQIQRGDLVTAIHTLREVLEAVPDYSSAKVILAHTLFKNKDLSWKSIADEIIEDKNSSESEIEMIHSIFQMDWSNQGIWNKEKEMALQKDRYLRFQKKAQPDEIKNEDNTMQFYSIRM